jgi:hypothetical protein
MTQVPGIAPHMKEQAEPFIAKVKSRLGKRQTPQPPSEGDGMPASQP